MKLVPGESYYVLTWDGGWKPGIYVGQQERNRHVVHANGGASTAVPYVAHHFRGDGEPWEWSMDDAEIPRSVLPKSEFSEEILQWDRLKRDHPWVATGTFGEWKLAGAINRLCEILSKMETR